MASQEILNYLDNTTYRETRTDLEQGVQLVTGAKVAIDCGCGAGSDIAFLRKEGFLVHAFDSGLEAISRCQKRFDGDHQVNLFHDSFSSFDYPRANLINADSSLFFCPETEFENVWQRMYQALEPNGLFVGSFLGPEDSMGGLDFDREAYWPDVLVLTEQTVKSLFNQFEIVLFDEHRSSKKAGNGELHNWHIFSIVARKLA